MDKTWRIGGFVSLSVLLHASLLVPWLSQPEPHRLTDASPHSAMALQLAAPAPQATAADNMPKTVSKNGQTAKASFDKASRIRAEQRPERRAQMAADSRARVLDRLRTDLSRHFHYPRLALRRGWEGRVTLAFRINPDGVIQNIQVAESSGYAMLDDSAREALKKVGQIRQAPAWLNGRSMDLRIPVIYRMNKG